MTTKRERIVTWEEQALLEQQCDLDHDTESASWRRALYARLDAQMIARSRHLAQGSAAVVATVAVGVVVLTILFCVAIIVIAAHMLGLL